MSESNKSREFSPSKVLSFTVDILYVYTYIHTYIYVCIYMYIGIQRNTIRTLFQIQYTAVLRKL